MDIRTKIMIFKGEMHKHTPMVHIQWVKHPLGHNFLLNILVHLYHTKYGYNANYYCQLHFGSFVSLTEMESLAFLANVGILFNKIITNSEEKEREKFFFCK
eukprot:TRINITY_DN9567_c1_g1_i1.p1 TRINITY_DN9567_c1_g1~~TRINITY_DN9567_c1_g1_i1.p1  ORF type:complete len:101 (+),score=11.14 TRINITY_DN9567_c1_g1_i1:106-408(+)